MEVVTTHLIFDSSQPRQSSGFGGPHHELLLPAKWAASSGTTKELVR